MRSPATLRLARLFISTHRFAGRALGYQRSEERTARDHFHFLPTISWISFKSVGLYTTSVDGLARTHFLRITPWGSMRKNVLIAVICFSLSTPKLRMIFRSGKSLSSG